MFQIQMAFEFLKDNELPNICSVRDKIFIYIKLGVRLFLTFPVSLNLHSITVYRIYQCFLWIFKYFVFYYQLNSLLEVSVNVLKKTKILKILS